MAVLGRQRPVATQPVGDAAAAAVRRPLLLELLVGGRRAVRRPALPLLATAAVLLGRHYLVLPALLNVRGKE